MTRRVVPLQRTETDSSGEIDLVDGEPFTGLVIDVDKNGELNSISESENGVPHGYSIDLANGRPVAVDEFFHGTEHGLFAEWRGGALAFVARVQIRTEDQRQSFVDGRPGPLVIDEEGAATVTRLRRLNPRLPPIELSAPELLARFQAAAPGLIAEARRGLGLE